MFQQLGRLRGRRMSTLTSRAAFSVQQHDGVGNGVEVGGILSPSITLRNIRACKLAAACSSQSLLSDAIDLARSFALLSAPGGAGRANRFAFVRMRHATGKTTTLRRSYRSARLTRQQIFLTCMRDVCHDLIRWLEHTFFCLTHRFVTILAARAIRHACHDSTGRQC